jgi:virulence-associated protein VagC
LCDVLLLRSRVGRHGGGLILEPRYESWVRMVGVGDETVDEVVKEEEDQDQKEVCDS